MQSVPLVANATSDAKGNLSVTFPPVAVNSVFTGTVSIPSAPPSASIMVLFNGQTVGNVLGASSYGTLQVQPTTTVQLVGTGFVPSTQYQAVGIGTLGPAGGPTPIPSPTVVAVTTGGFVQEVLTASPISSGGSTVTVSPPPGTNTLWIEMGALAGGIAASGLLLTVQGVQSGYYYTGAGGSILPYLPQNGSNLYTWVVPVSAAMDSQFLVTGANGSSVNMILNVFADTTPRRFSDFNQPYLLKVAAAANLGGATSTLLTGPARLFAVELQSAGGVNSSVALQLGTTNLLLLGIADTITMSFPADTILGYGQTLSLVTSAGIAGSASAVYAYP